MEIKDYYRILELQPTATVPEIKRAYRKLAHQFHPDKNNNDPYALAQFSAIKEAYEILTNPIRKDHYLQQRWYQQSRGKKFSTHDLLTPATVLRSCLELNRYVASLDVHRMDREGLILYIREIFNTDSLQQLQTFKEPDINQQIIISILDTITALKMQQAVTISQSLNQLAGDDTVSRNMIAASMERHRKSDRQEKYKPLMMILITLLICLLIYMMTR